MAHAWKACWVNSPHEFESRILRQQGFERNLKALFLLPKTAEFQRLPSHLTNCMLVGETDDTAESLSQSAYGTGEREDSDVRAFIQDYFDHNKELTPDGLYWGVPSCKMLNEAKDEFSKQQVLDGRRRPKPLFASKKYGNMWW